MNILCELRLCCYPKNNMCNSGSERMQQYINGLNRFFELNENNNFDILITDNSIDSNNKLPENILNIIPNKCKIITCMNNNYGIINKGAGDIEQWIYNKDVIQKYEWVMHFEPRQLLNSNFFIDSFLKNPRNLFTLGENKKHFNTGLFAIKTTYLMKFMNEYQPILLIKLKLGIEYAIFNFFETHKIHYDLETKMDLLWFNNIDNQTYSW